MTPGALKAAERELLKFSKMDLDEIEVRKVYIDGEGRDHITTTVVGDPSLPKMVLVHGYGGSGVLLYRLFKELSQHYQIFAIDLLGMGSSSRPPFPCENGEQADLYCMDFMEKWRIAMGELTGFVMVGHSYGGYISGTYASKFP